MTQEWTWIALSAALEAHELQLEQHGGIEGIRDKGLLESAMARPQQMDAYGAPDVADLAAAYAFGIARNHPFADGKKRTSAVVSEAFLMVNGYLLTANDPEMLQTFVALAAGELSEEGLASWFRENIAET